MRIKAAIAWVLFGLGACGEPEIRVPELLSLVAVFPSHGDIDVVPEAEALVYFSHAPAPDQAIGDRIYLECRGAPPCENPTAAACSAPQVASATSVDSLNRLARLDPAASLQPDTCYLLVIEEGLAADDPEVAALPTTVRAAFRTR